MTAICIYVRDFRPEATRGLAPRGATLHRLPRMCWLKYGNRSFLGMEGGSTYMVFFNETHDGCKASKNTPIWLQTL